MPAVTFKDFLRYGLGELHDFQRQVLPLIDRMETVTRQNDLRKRFRQHREETLRQIENLDRCFDLLGTDSPKVESAVARAFTADMIRFYEPEPGPWAAEAYLLEIAARLEHYERACYDGALHVATALRHGDIQRLLTQNIEYTRSMCQWIETTRAALVERLVATRATTPAE